MWKSCALMKPPSRMLTSWRLDGRDGVAAGHREQAPAPAARQPLVEHRLGLLRRDVQQLVLVRDDHVAVAADSRACALSIALVPTLAIAAAGEAVGQELAAGRRWRCRPPPSRRRGARCRSGRRRRGSGRRRLRPGRCSFPSPRRACAAVHRDLAAAAERDAAHRRDHRHAGVAHAQHRVLQLLDLAAAMPLPPLFMNTGIIASRLAPAENTSSRRPDHQALVVASRPARRAFSRPSITPGLMSVHLGGDAGDQHLAVERPDAHRRRS